MILIADSGSTKTDWRLASGGTELQEIHTRGFNPYFQDTSSIISELEASLVPSVTAAFAAEKLDIYFYGAGCSSPVRTRIINNALKHIFPHAAIVVEHDLLAAARALCGKAPGMVAILGTGSNSCLYDGQSVVKNFLPLGYILGDEGSGADMGKKLIKDILSNNIEKHIQEEFYDTHELTPEKILDSVYRSQMPSRFLASFSKFIAAHKNEEYFYQLIRESFEDFFLMQICRYENYQELPLSCVGSVAFHYRDALRDVAEKFGIVVGNTLESPIRELTSYHLAEQSSH